MSDLAADWDAIKAPPKSPNLADEWDSIKPASPKAAEPTAKGEAPGKIMSGLAGAGSAVGRGALAVQQLVGKGAELLGDVTGIDAVRGAGAWLDQDARQGAIKLSAENAPYEEANPASNITGQVAGMVLSPVNKLVPMGGPASSLTGAAAKGAAQGAALNALTSPVTTEGNFLVEKGKQGIVGALGGAAGATAAYGLSKGINKAISGIQSIASRAKVGNPAEAAEGIVNKTLADSGVDVQVLRAERPELFDGLRSQVSDAIKAGKTVDPKALQRLVEAQTLPVPVPMLKGQITRDPMQYAMEQNLRGIQGVGEPLKETMTASNRALIANLDAMGASKGADVVTAGKGAIDTLKAADEAAQKAVSGAYKAFKDATGKELDVPLKGLAQDYAKIIEERGSAIPAEVRKKFESYGLLAGKQNQTFSISDAENLIKNYINKNYNAADSRSSGALDELRQAVQKAISEGAGSSAEGTAAAGLAKAARTAAADRFKVIDATPGLKAALRGDEPDRFIQKFILQGNSGEIKSMMKVLEKDPVAVENLQNSVVSFIKDRVTKGRQEGSFSEDQIRAFVKDPNMSARLTQVLGAEKMGQLKQLANVAENVIYAPFGSAVNRSNTAATAANIVKSEVHGGGLNTLLEISKRVPGMTGAANAAQAANQSARASKLVDEAVNPSVGTQSGDALIREILSKNLRPDTQAARAGAAYAETKRKERRK